MAAKKGLNGSPDLLAQAMREAFKEVADDAATQAATQAVEPVIGLIADSEKRLEKKIAGVNKNVQAQLAQHRKGVSDDMKAATADKK